MARRRPRWACPSWTLENPSNGGWGWHETGIRVFNGTHVPGRFQVEQESQPVNTAPFWVLVGIVLATVAALTVAALS